MAKKKTKIAINTCEKYMMHILVELNKFRVWC